MIKIFFLDLQADHFKLHVGSYSGTAGDSLSYHNGMKFSTYDRDNDNSGSSCATDEKSAWWFNSCEYCNLNGQNYGSGVPVSTDNGIHWDKFGGGSISLKSATMAIRPMN